MRLRGKIYKDGKFWLAEVPILDAMTQGHTKREAYDMVVDMLQTMANNRNLEVQVIRRSHSEFDIASPDVRTMISLILRRARERSGHSLAEVATLLGVASRNTYARYEQGRCAPSFEKFLELYQAVCPDSDLVLDNAT